MESETRIRGSGKRSTAASLGGGPRPWPAEDESSGTVTRTVRPLCATGVGLRLAGCGFVALADVLVGRLVAGQRRLEAGAFLAGAASFALSLIVNANGGGRWA